MVLSVHCHDKFTLTQVNRNEVSILHSHIQKTYSEVSVNDNSLKAL